MKKILGLSTVLFFCGGLTMSANAQYYFYNDKFYDNPLVFEVGISLGGMNCLTDLGGKKGKGKNLTKDINWKTTKLTSGVYLSALYKNAIGIRLEGSFGQVAAYDSILKKVKATTTGRYERNLSFRSNITEFSALAEIHPLNFKVDLDREPSRYSPYLLAGIGYFNFNPQARLNGAWIDLHPLRTEGQGFAEYPGKKEYSLRQVNVPIGMGVKYELNSFLNARFEVVYRKLFTDYLDDVSGTYADATTFFTRLTPQQAALAAQLHDRRQELDPLAFPTPGQQRGDPADNDSYFSFQLKIGLILGRQRVR
jgi:Domain of unknown function (DUF6089)